MQTSPSVRGPQIWEQLSWAVLFWGLMKTSCGAAVIWSLTRTEDLVSRHLTHMVGKLGLVVGRRSQFLSIWASPQIAWASLWHGEWLLPQSKWSQRVRQWPQHHTTAKEVMQQLLPQYSVCHVDSNVSVWQDYTRAWILGGAHYWKWSYWLAEMIYITPMCKMHSPKVPQNFTPFIVSAQSCKSYLNQIQLMMKHLRHDSFSQPFEHSSFPSEAILIKDSLSILLPSPNTHIGPQ